MSSKPSPRRSPRPRQPASPAPDAEPLLALGAPSAGAPSPDVRVKLLARVRAERAAAAGTALPGWRFDSASDQTGWRPSGAPGLRFKTLSVDEARDVALVLIELAPGARFPDHRHDRGGDEGVVLTGDVITGGRLMRAGDYYHAAEGTDHVDTFSPGGCTALISLTVRAWKSWRSPSPS
jgi:anti-sigma factor ChrR (cupin superfamily)